MPAKRLRPPPSAADSEITRLKHELAARMAEADWLKSHYDRHLREALARASRAPPPLPALPQPAPETSRADAAELLSLRSELERMAQAERRYLDRIEELKEALSEARRPLAAG